MTRLLTAGFETGSIQELNGVAYIVTAPSTAEARTGSYALPLLGSMLPGATAYVTHAFDANHVELFFRIAWKLDATGIAGYPVIAFRDSAGDYLLVLQFNGASQVFQLLLGNPVWDITPGTLIATGSVAIRAGLWYVLEGHVVIDDETGEFTLKVNAVTDISFSGDTQGTALDSVRSWQAIGPVGGGYLYVDDIAFNDETGSFENSYPGLGGVFFLKTNGDGATTEFTPSAGSDHYALVDDVPANTTDWVQGANAGDLELFNIEDMPDYVTAINVVQPIFQAAVAVSGSNELRDVVREGTTNYSGSTTQTVISIAPAYVLYRGETYYEQPDGVSGAFDEAALDALQVGFEIPA